MLELWDYLVQFLVTAYGFCAAWLVSFVFLLALTLTLPTAEERRFRTRLCRLVPVVCLPHFISCTSPTATCSRTFSCAA